MRRWIRAVAVVSVVAVVCTWRPDPWFRLTSRELDRLNTLRLTGIALTEDGHLPEAIRSFQAIRRARPALALGWADEAAVHLLRREYGEAVRLAREAVRLRPK